MSEPSADEMWGNAPDWLRVTRGEMPIWGRSTLGGRAPLQRADLEKVHKQALDDLAKFLLSIALERSWRARDWPFPQH